MLVVDEHGIPLANENETLGVEKQKNLGDLFKALPNTEDKLLPFEPVAEALKSVCNLKNTNNTAQII